MKKLMCITIERWKNLSMKEFDCVIEKMRKWENAIVCRKNERIWMQSCCRKNDRTWTFYKENERIQVQ